MVLTLIMTFIIFIIFIVINKFKKFTDILFSFVASFIISGLIFIFLWYGSYFFADREYKYKFNQDLIAIQDNQIYVVSRYDVNNTMVYNYMIKYNGGYISQKAEQNDSIFYETNDRPMVKIYKKEFNNEFILKYIYYEINQEEYKYEFYIPKNSIKQDFNIDLK